MPTTPNEWLGLALATAFLLLLAAGLAALGWRGLRAFRSAAREGRVDDADGAWRAASDGSASGTEPKRFPTGRHPVLLWVARLVGSLVVAPVVLVFWAWRNVQDDAVDETTDSSLLRIGLFNFRKGKIDNGLDPHGWYD